MLPGCDNNAAFVGRSSVFESFSLAAMYSLVMPQLGREAGVGYSNTVQKSWFCIMITSMHVVFVNEAACVGVAVFPLDAKHLLKAAFVKYLQSLSMATISGPGLTFV